MKKVIIGISAVVLAAFVIILTVSAQEKPQEVKKCCTEAASKDCAKGPHASSCCGAMKYGSTADAKACEHKNCKSAADSTCTGNKTGKSCCKASATTQAEASK
jgi:hypothetical protein